MRLQIITDGQPLNEAWGKFVDTLFAKLDADKSGSLDDKELTKLRPMLALLTGRNMLRGTATAPGAPMTRENLATYLQQNDHGPLRLPPAANNNLQGRQLGFRRGGTPTPDTLDAAFMELLDANKDGKLSPTELTAGVEILSKLDVDENEAISVDELLRRPTNPFYYEEAAFNGRMGGPVNPGVELLSFGRKPDTNLAKRLLARYGPKPATNPPRDNPKIKGLAPTQPVVPDSTARRLTPNNLKIGREAFEALDQDGDGELDTEELARFGQSAVVDVEITFRLGTRRPGRVPAEVV